MKESPPQLIAIITLSGDKSDLVWEINRTKVKLSNEYLSIVDSLFESIFLYFNNNF